MRKASIFLVLFSALFSKLYAQTTTNCVEAESILIASCAPGVDEGKNEMVRFLVGPNPLTVNQITVDWATTTLPFTGWVQNATTASKTAQINASIVSCGQVVEPLNGIIPANKKGIMITSYNMNPTANSFAGLTDTLYILYQNSNTSTGHFANFGTGTRTFKIFYPSCTDEVVTYDRSQLSNNPGDYANFTQAGVPSYGNDGCTAPISPFSIEAGNSPMNACPGGTINLSATLIGSASYQQWTAGNGIFSSPGNLTTTYTVPSSQTTPFYVFFKAKGICADTLVDSILVNIQSQNPIQISASGPLSICTGENLTLSATGGGSSYQWVGGPASAQYTINAPGTYTVQSSDACYNYSQSVTVNPSSSPNISVSPSQATICAGSTITATATATGTISWSNGTSGSTITINSPGQYIATVTNGCGTASDTLVVTAGVTPTAQITNSNPISVCSSSTPVNLTGSGAGTLTWSTGENGTSINVNGNGTYYLVSQTTCGTDTAFVTINASDISAQFTADPTSGFAPLAVNVTNQSTGASSYFWSFGNGNTSTDENPPGQTYTQPGTYTVLLAVANAQGCVDTVTVDIIVATQMTVVLPNIFTPNGDQTNDQYIIIADGVSSMKGEIFNRWGQKMFAWNDPLIGWDGKAMFGGIATPGVYFCVLEATDALGKTQTFKTTVTLSR